MKTGRHIVAISAAVSVAVFGCVYFLVSNSGNSKSAVTSGIADVADQKSVPGIPVKTQGVPTSSDAKAVSSGTTSDMPTKVVVPQPARTTKTS